MLMSRGFFIDVCCSKILTQICVTVEDHCFMNMETIENCVSQKDNKYLKLPFLTPCIYG